MALLTKLRIASSHLGKNVYATPICHNFSNFNSGDLKVKILNVNSPGVSGLCNSTCTKTRMTLPIWNSCCLSRTLNQQSMDEKSAAGQNFNSRWLSSEGLAGSYSQEPARSYFGKLLGVSLLFVMGMNHKLIAEEPTKVVVTEAAEAEEGAEAEDNVEGGQVLKGPEIEEARRLESGSVYEANVTQNVRIDPRTEEMLCLDTINEFNFEDFSTNSSVFWALVSESKLEEEFIYDEGKILFDFNDPFYKTLGFPSMRLRPDITPADVKSLSECELALLRSSAESALHESHCAVMQACLQRMQILADYRAELDGQLKRVETLKDLPTSTWHSLFKGYLLVNIDNHEAEQNFVKKRDSLHMKELVVNPVLLGASESMSKLRRVCSLLGAHEAVASVDEDSHAWRIIILDITNEIEILKNKIVEIKVMVARRKLEYELQEDKKALVYESYWDWLQNWRRRRILARRSLLQNRVERRQKQLIAALNKDLMKRREELRREISAKANQTRKWYKKSEELLEERKRLIAFREKALFAMKAKEEKEKAKSIESTEPPSKVKGAEKEPLRWARFS